MIILCAGSLAAGLAFFISDLFQPLLGRLATAFPTPPELEIYAPSVLNTVRFVSGFILVFLSIFLLMHLLFTTKVNAILQKNYRFFLVLLLCLYFVAITLLSFQKSFNPDELEHVHSSWYIQHDNIPYLDYFEHHNPLLWYTLVFFLEIFGPTTKTLIFIRLFMLVLTAGIAITVYKIGRLVGYTWESGILSSIFILSMPMFVLRSVEIRPDVPQVLFGLIVIHQLLIFRKTHNKRHMALSGFFAAVSFLFLQKAIFLLFPLAFLFLVWLIKKRLTFLSLFYFVAPFLIPCFLYFLFLLRSGSLNDYLLTNWSLNMHFGYRFSVLVPLKTSAAQSPFFWPIALGSLIWITLKKKGSEEYSLLAFLSLFLLLSVLIVKRPHEQYFMLTFALLSSLSACFLSHFWDKHKFHAHQRIGSAILISVIPFCVLLGASQIKNTHQLQKIQYVLENSLPSDYVYDGESKFNVFRYDLHYFWFQFQRGRSFDTYNRLTENRFGDYDACQLIKTKRPKFISDYKMDLEKCGIEKEYRPTPFPHLYQRRSSLENE
jgi:hypothetical protein